MPSSKASQRQQELHNKVVVVTGASRGIGKTLAVAFAREGAIVIGAARKATGPDSVEETVRRITSEGGRAIAVPCDVTKEDEVKALVDTVVRRFRRIDVLVNNAGIGIWKDILDLTLDDWNSSVAVNLKGVFLACKFVVPVMIEQGGGNIINVSSSMGRRYVPEDLAYSPTKAGLDRFTSNLANDVKKYNISVNSYCPGYVKTDMARKGSPEPVEMVIPSAIWLAGQTASNFTGQVLDRKDFGKTWGPGITTKL